MHNSSSNSTDKACKRVEATEMRKKENSMKKNWADNWLKNFKRNKKNKESKPIKENFSGKNNISKLGKEK